LVYFGLIYETCQINQDSELMTYEHVSAE